MAKKRTLLLFGATGKLGNALVRAMAGEFDVIPKGSRDLDAADLDGVAELTLGVRPDLIVNAAALMGVDPCERDPARALRLNALFPRRLAELAAQMGATVAHISTDAVFDGRKGAPYVETDAPAPLRGWMVQVGSFGDRRRADAMRTRMTAYSDRAFIETAGGLHRVRVGRFAEKRDADRLARQLLERENLDSWVTFVD